MGAIPFCAPKNGELHKIVEPFLKGQVFLCFPIFDTEGIKNESNNYYLSFISVAFKMFLWLRAGHLISCAHLNGDHITLCSGKNRPTGNDV